MSAILHVPQTHSVAKQIEGAGLKVGDVIVGRAALAPGDWHEAELTLLWVGDVCAAWSCRTRSWRRQEWGRPYESTQWVLTDRPWRRVASEVLTLTPCPTCGTGFRPRDVPERMREALNERASDHA